MGNSEEDPLPPKLPYGVTNAVTTRGSFGDTFGTPLVKVNSFQWFGPVHVFGFSLPRMRRFMPLATWFCLLPVAGPIQSAGFVLSGHVSVGLMAHRPAHPYASAA